MAGTKALLALLPFVKWVQSVVRQVCRGWGGGRERKKGEMMEETEMKEKKAEKEESI